METTHTSKKTILFVDDDPNSIRHASRMFRIFRNRCTVTFASSGEEALSMMSRGNFDILMADIQMPGVNGIELLVQARKHYPRIVRIIISDQDQISTICQTADLAHQFIAKPFNTKALTNSLTRAFSLCDFLSDEKFRKLILQTQTLPSLPTLYLDIVKELQSPDPSSDKIGEIISKDMGMSAKVLQLVNSAYFGLARHVAAPAEAAVMLGTETIRDLVLSLHIFSQFDQNKIRRLSLTNLWDHSLTVALFTKIIMRSMTSDKEVIDEAFLAGLLHDLGKLIFAENFTMKYYSAIGRAHRKGIELEQAEMEIFGATHAQIGAYLLGVWGLPDNVVESTAYHHNPAQLKSDTFSVPVAVHIANVFSHEEYPNRLQETAPTLNEEHLQKIGVYDKVSLWRKKCLE